ncbi:DUF1905 domain-containing protein [Arthrobacter sp. zg-Y826]|uniref:DUF1905 domain-containing protein n=1 Tax=Arthrobacter jinronghuae TaxID=2964609 RepID=UPI0021081CC0|nr:DUF1905 domain-containing protein [Arthrobacter jinronghuae]MCQ1957540.1 DUF1905 domain-containing protein [Arthrobacter jinronghuae]
MDTTFSAEVFEWRGPAPFYWVLLPEDAADYVRAQAASATYGWGAIPVYVRIGTTYWETSLLPRSGGYALPLRKDVRLTERIDDGDRVAVVLSVATRGGRAAASPVNTKPVSLRESPRP